MTPKQRILHKAAEAKRRVDAQEEWHLPHPECGRKKTLTRNGVFTHDKEPDKHWSLADRYTVVPYSHRTGKLRISVI